MRPKHPPRTADELILLARAGVMKPFRNLKAVPGLGETYFAEIARLVGSEPLEALKLGRKWRAFLASADRPDFVLRAKAATLRIQGKWGASAQAFLEAGRMSEDPVCRHSFRLGAVDSLARAGKPKEAVRLGRRLAKALRGLGEQELGAKALLNVGNALVWMDEHRAARNAYRSALPHLTNPLELAIGKLGLSTAELFGGNPGTSAALALEAEQLFLDAQMTVFARQAEVNVAHVALLQGRYDDAWELLRGLAGALTEGPERVRVDEFLGDVFYALNLYEEAAEHYRAAELKMGDMILNRANCMLGIGRSEAALGNRPAAQQALERAISLYRRADNASWEAVAQLERAKLTGTRRGMESAITGLTNLRMPFWEAQGQLALAEAGDVDALIRAGRLIQRGGYQGLRWRAMWLKARESRRLADFRAMAEAIVAERALSRSLASRTAYLRDKRGAMQEFLAQLVRTGTEESLREAVDWVSRTRSAALIDEILAGDQFSPVREELESLRAEIVSEGPNQGGARRANSRLTRRMPALLDLRTPGAGADRVSVGGATWIDTGPEMVCIESGSTRKVGSRCIKQTLQWLEFEMMAPMTDRSASPESCERLLSELREDLGDSHRIVCPDGVLWQVPWALLSEQEPQVSLSPRFAGGATHTLPKAASVLIWKHQAKDLARVDSEVQAILEQFPDARVCSTSAEAKASLDEAYDYIHVSCHARLNPRNPMFSFFEFEDGPLYAVEIARSRLSVGLAILAACDTGRFHLALPDEPDGFVRAFLARGAQSVVAGLWPLDDEAAYVTMGPLVRSLRAGLPVREALSKARQECRNRFRHPYFWGPLTLFAGYADAPQ